MRHLCALIVSLLFPLISRTDIKKKGGNYCLISCSPVNKWVLLFCIWTSCTVWLWQYHPGCCPPSLSQRERERDVHVRREAISISCFCNWHKELDVTDQGCFAFLFSWSMTTQVCVFSGQAKTRHLVTIQEVSARNEIYIYYFSIGHVFLISKQTLKMNKHWHAHVYVLVE